MKRRDLIKKLKKIAADHGQEYSESEGGNHTIVRIGNRPIPVPRHREIPERTAKNIIKEAQQ